MSFNRQFNTKYEERDFYKMLLGLSIPKSCPLVKYTKTKNTVVTMIQYGFVLIYSLEKIMATKAEFNKSWKLTTQ